MRLFIAICLNDSVKDALSETAADLRDAAKRGHYTRRENMHLTLVFIGESNRVDDIIGIMEEAAEEAFTEPLRIALADAGVFRGKGGDLHWVGVENTPALKNLVRALSERLRADGFEIEKRRFTPHVTIAREVLILAGADITVRPAVMMADHISLMRSDRVGGQLVYTEIASVCCG